MLLLKFKYIPLGDLAAIHGFKFVFIIEKF